ncbi:MAG TPA: enoyl-CoA hydratase/isomerase family protein [Acidimicrobiales bacterium]
MEFESVVYGVEDRVATITLNRPEALNAFDRRMCEEMRDARTQVEDDPDVHAVVLRAAGERALCAGLDTKGPYGQPEDLSSIRTVVCGTAPLSPDDADAFHERYGAAVLVSSRPPSSGAGWRAGTSPTGSGTGRTSGAARAGPIRAASCGWSTPRPASRSAPTGRASWR